VNGPAGTSAGAGSAGLGWLLDDLLRRARGVHSAILLSADGLLLARSAGLSPAEGDQLSAVASGLQSLANAAGRMFGGGSVRQTTVELDDAFVIVTAAGSAACLAVLTEGSADLGLVAYELAVLARRAGTHLQAAPRQSGQGADPGPGGHGGAALGVVLPGGVPPGGAAAREP
jgi:predicted regulator of Ras-like GTPase activity (Roadblock/LC7/MglB family)